MISTKKLLVLGMACSTIMTSGMNVFAADVQEGQNAYANTDVSIVKENPAPIFSVGIPSSITIDSENPENMVFTMSEEDLKNIPEGKKVSISIADAGYGDVTNTFALASEDGKVAPYTIYGSKSSTRPQDINYNKVGSLVASFYGDENVQDGQASVGRAVKSDNYEDLDAGTYEGYLTFSVDVRNQ